MPGPYYVDSAAAGTATGADWTNAFVTLLAATAVATSAEVIYVANDHSESQITAMTLTCPTTVGLRILSVDKALGLSPTTVSAGASVALGAGSVALSILGCAYIYGITFLGATNNHGSANISAGNTPIGAQIQTYDNCELQTRSANSGAHVTLGMSASTSVDEIQITLLNCRLGVGSTGASINLQHGRFRFFDCTLVGTAALGDLFQIAATGTTADIECVGCDFSGKSHTNLVNVPAASPGGVCRFISCKLYVAGTAATFAGAVIGGPEVWIHDCHTGDVHGIFGYANALGSIVTESTIKFTGGAAGQSWKITTTANASFTSPFYTPWVDWYNTGAIAIAPYLEVVRTGSATALNNDDLWVEVEAKVSTGFTNSTFSSDRRGLLAANAAQDTGASTWDGAPATPWYGKLAVASLTPAEVGHIRARVGVALASIAGTLYVDPQIRT